MTGVFPKRRSVKFVDSPPLGGSKCRAERNGYTCTMDKDHAGRHIAPGVEGTLGAPAGKAPVCAEWSDMVRGFSAMDPERRHEIASMGVRAAQASGKAHRFTTEEAKIGGRKSGKLVSADRQHMAEIGRKGGLAVSTNIEHMRESGGKGGSSVSDGPNGRKHMSDLGRLGAAEKRRRRLASHDADAKKSPDA